MVWDTRSIRYRNPRAQVLKGFVETLAREKGRMKNTISTRW